MTKRKMRRLQEEQNQINMQHIQNAHEHDCIMQEQDHITHGQAQTQERTQRDFQDQQQNLQEQAQRNAQELQRLAQDQVQHDFQNQLNDPPSPQPGFDPGPPMDFGGNPFF